MRVAVISCWKYRDTWRPFFGLFRHFWPDCPYKLWLVTDTWEPGYFEEAPGIFMWPSKSWSATLKAFAERSTEPILMMLDDFFLTSPVHGDLVERGLELMEKHNAVCVRLYPCPGADHAFGDTTFGLIDTEAPYRISTQAAIWNSDYLKKIAEKNGPDAWDFEIQGTRYAQEHPDLMLSVKRDAPVWPMEYLCSAISRGRWNPAAKHLCDRLGIDADWTQRPMMSI